MVDVGINRLPDGKLVGDVDFESVQSIAEFITGKSTESDFTIVKPRSISGIEAAISIIPGAKLEGAIIKAGEVVEKAVII